ncbi:MAG TPA: hypothetical protein VKB76_16085 [Ktedonobacterales bacterium]|nr:hypothetical protein [Ktedonobacterales bacterium]
MGKMTVYVLQHSHELDGCDEAKMIGVYSSPEQAQAAVERLRQQPGFAEYPDDFSIDGYLLDEDNWTQGFVTVTHGEDTSEG